MEGFGSPGLIGGSQGALFGKSKLDATTLSLYAGWQIPLGERFTLAAGAVGFAWVCYQEALAWARERQVFGKRLADHQVVRHRLVDMLASIETARAMLEETAWRLDHSPPGDAALVASICMLKNVATRCMQFCADAAVQTLGGMGYMRGTKSERIYREVKVNMIGGGAEEIMKDLAARQLGL